MSIGLAFTPSTTTVTIGAVSTASSSGTITAGFGALRVVNSTSSVIFLAWSETASAVATVASGLAMLPNSVETFSIDPLTITVAVRALSGSGNVYFTTGDGV